ncbi:MAG: stage II sporulation protein M [Clostridia bacterium]|nr:stage II sporulation protein M [Clostridia bacterium]
MELGKGLLFLFSTILLQNILFIPCVIALAVSGMKLHNSIMKDKRRENIKLEILRHTLFSLFILFLLICSSLIEVYVSKNVLLMFIKYI